MDVAVIVLFLLLLLMNYEKGICVIMVLSPILNMISLSGRFTILLPLIIVSFIILFIKYYKYEMDLKTFPFTLSFFLIVLSYVLTNIMSDDPHWPLSFSNILTQYLIVIPFWCVVHQPNNLLFLRKLLYVFFAVAFFYGIFEYLIGDNPLYDWYIQSPLSYGYVISEDKIRFDMLRCHSFFRGVGAFGLISSFGFCFYWNCLMKANEGFPVFKRNLKPITAILLLLSVICVFITITRSSIVAFMMGVMVIFLFSKVTFKYKFFFVAFAFIGIFLFSGFIDNLITSFTDLGSAGGSSASMRLIQLDIALSVWKSNPIFGGGLAATSEAMNMFALLYGAESVWFGLLMNLGALGVLVYAYNLFVCSKYAINNRNVIAFATILIFVVAKTLSTAPGVDPNYFIMLVLFYVQIEDLEKTDIMEE